MAVQLASNSKNLYCPRLPEEVPTIVNSPVSTQGHSRRSSEDSISKNLLLSLFNTAPFASLFGAEPMTPPNLSRSNSAKGMQPGIHVVRHSRSKTGPAQTEKSISLSQLHQKAVSTITEGPKSSKTKGNSILSSLSSFGSKAKVILGIVKISEFSLYGGPSRPSRNADLEKQADRRLSVLNNSDLKQTSLSGNLIEIEGESSISELSFELLLMAIETRNHNHDPTFLTNIIKSVFSDPKTLSGSFLVRFN